MSAPALTLAAVRKRKPCDDAMIRLSGLPKRGKITAQQARDAGASYDDIIWIASAVAMDDDNIARRLTAFVNDCAKRVLHIWEQAHPDDSRPRRAIEACDAFLAGTGSEAEWKAAAWDARAAWDAWAAWAARAAWDAWDAWDARAARAAWDAWAAWDALPARAAWAALPARAAWAARAARDAFYAWQFDRLIYWLGDSPVPLPMPSHGKDDSEALAMGGEA